MTVPRRALHGTHSTRRRARLHTCPAVQFGGWWWLRSITGRCWPGSAAPCPTPPGPGSCSPCGKPAHPADLADRLGVSRQSLSIHLTCLRGCGLVVAVPQGRRVRYETQRRAAPARVGRPDRSTTHRVFAAAQDDQHAHASAMPAERLDPDGDGRCVAARGTGGPELVGRGPCRCCWSLSVSGCVGRGRRTRTAGRRSVVDLDGRVGRP
jgi:DNA-binding transcriptional ArsR family regulator